MKATGAKHARGPVRNDSPRLLIGTRKGGFFLQGDRSRRSWKMSKPLFLGHIVYHIVLDPRDRKTMLAAARTGHLGPTVFRSTNAGRSWKETHRPPAFQKVGRGRKPLVVNHVFWLTPGHASEPNVWYAGSSPQGLFRSEDGGRTWDGVQGFNEHPKRFDWVGGDQDGTPDGPKMHSILVDPRDPKHMYIGMSTGGVFESLDQGANWKPLNKGCAADFLPIAGAEYGHDPHNLQLHPLNPDRLYQQNHCGIYRMDRADGHWIRIGSNMPKPIGDIGFPIVLDPRIPTRYGFSDGWNERLASNEPGREARRLRLAQRGAKLEATGQRAAVLTCLVHGQTSGDVPRPTGPSGSLLRHDEW